LLFAIVTEAISRAFRVGLPWELLYRGEFGCGRELRGRSDKKT